MIDIESWMNHYRQAVVDEFGHRVLFIGLQGSYGRKEPTAHSDIDVVLILDQVGMGDLILYRKIVDQLPHRKLLCGFVSGREELACWSKSDLFQFYFDTKAVQGSLDAIIPPITAKDAKQAVIAGVCNIYHACSHNFLHTLNIDVLKALYKSAFFVMQAEYYCKTGIYLCNRSELLNRIEEKDKSVLSVIFNLSDICQSNFIHHSELLLSWSKALICQYGAG